MGFWVCFFGSMLEMKSVAQMVEPSLKNQKAGGSIPATGRMSKCPWARHCHPKVAPSLVCSVPTIKWQKTVKSLTHHSKPLVLQHLYHVKNDPFIPNIPLIEDQSSVGGTCSLRFGISQHASAPLITSSKWSLLREPTQQNWRNLRTVNLWLTESADLGSKAPQSRVQVPREELVKLNLKRNWVSLTFGVLPVKCRSLKHQNKLWLTTGRNQDEIRLNKQLNIRLIKNQMKL